MRLLFFMGLFTTFFISGCSYNKLYLKERDARNAFLEKPLIIPPDISIPVSTCKGMGISSDNFTDVTFQLIFNENINLYKNTSNNLPMDRFDMLFLTKLNADKRIEYVRNELNAEYLNITSKNNRFINKILNLKVDESISVPDKDYMEIKHID